MTLQRLTFAFLQCMTVEVACFALRSWICTHHFIVLFKLGWLTVLSSMKMVEQELYFFDRGPGETCQKERTSIFRGKAL